MEHVWNSESTVSLIGSTINKRPLWLEGMCEGKEWQELRPEMWVRAKAGGCYADHDLLCKGIGEI